MPQKHTIKTYVAGGFYHIYNRGVEKRVIFEDASDYKVFLKYLKEYLSKRPDKKLVKKDFTLQGTSLQGIPHQPKNYHDKITLVAYCLMPNHFHLQIKQNSNRVIESFMRSLATRYSMYFNKKYNRVGKLFQGHYKGKLILNDSYMLHLSRYIHLNPQEHTTDIINTYSSYADYLQLRNTKWVHPNVILNFFNNPTIPEIHKYNSYKNFVENYKQDSGKILGRLTLES